MEDKFQVIALEIFNKVNLFLTRMKIYKLFLPKTNLKWLKKKSKYFGKLVKKIFKNLIMNLKSNKIIIKEI